MEEETQNMHNTSNVQGIVQTILNAINSLPNLPQLQASTSQETQNNSVRSFSSPAEELNSQFQIPQTRGQTSHYTAYFCSKENSFFIRVQSPINSVKASLAEKGLYVDAFQLDKNWGEACLSVYGIVLPLSKST
jgi:hypothetical protein